MSSKRRKVNKMTFIKRDRMKKKSTYLQYVLAFILLLPLYSINQTNPKPDKGLTLQFHHFVGDQRLVLDDSTYTNALGQAYTVTKLNYYIGNIRLTKTDGKEYFLEDYFFISEDEEKVASKTILLDKIPAGEYTSIQFLIGVDSLHNCSGAQSGALDPINAMFWTWNTGYIFLKLEGKSTFSTLPGNTLEYHIGGYKEPSNCVRSVTLNFENPIVIDAKMNTKLNLKTDVSEILKSPTAIDFKQYPAINSTLNATMMADNYIDIFSILK